MPVTWDFLSDHLNYNVNTGLLTFKPRPEMPDSWQARWANRPALTYHDKNGYMRGIIDGEKIYAHRAAYSLATGTEYRSDIYHRSGNRLDNRLFNLGCFAYGDTYGYPLGYPLDENAKAAIRDGTMPERLRKSFINPLAGFGIKSQISA